MSDVRRESDNQSERLGACGGGGGGGGYVNAGGGGGGGGWLYKGDDHDGLCGLGGGSGAVGRGGHAIQLHEPDVCKYEGSYYVTYINVEKVLFKKIFKSHSQFDNKLTLRDGGWPVLQSRVSVFDELGMRKWI